MPFEKFTACIQVPDYYVEKLLWITENRTTNIGFLLNVVSYRKEVEVLRAFVPMDLVGVE